MDWIELLIEHNIHYDKESSLLAKQKLAELSVMPINSQNTPPVAEV